jgi:hypothetical protein
MVCLCTCVPICACSDFHDIWYEGHAVKNNSSGPSSNPLVLIIVTKPQREFSFECDSIALRYRILELFMKFFGEIENVDTFLK